MKARKCWVLAAALFSGAGCSGGGESPDQGAAPGEESPASIDLRSFRLGSIAAFAEMVGAGVKKLALSAPMEAEEVTALLEQAEVFAREQGVELYLEEDFLVTDLFSAELTEGKQVLLIYRGSTAEEYLQLKAEKRALESRGEYEGEARLGVARRFGALLSYTDEKIQSLLEGRE